MAADDVFSQSGIGLPGLGRAQEKASTGAYPTYQVAGDVHDYANGSLALSDPTTWGERFGNVGKFIVAASYSGAYSLINSGAAVGSWLGMGTEQTSVEDQLYQLDSDIGAYYSQNKQSVDIAGFITTSLVPGLGGVKLLNAGTKVLRSAVESGKVGGVLGKAVGLMQPADALATSAAATFAETQATFTYINAGVLRSIAAGAGGLALEGAAFEVAVAATMFKSPVLDDADAWDITKNILIGATFGGVFGAAFQTARTGGIVKKAIKEADIAEKGITFTRAGVSGFTPADNIILASENLNATPVLDKNADLKSVRSLEKRVATQEGKKRAAVHQMTAGSNAEEKTEFANQMATTLTGMRHEDLVANIAGAQQFGKMAATLDAEKALLRATAEGKAGATVASAATPAVKVSFVRLTGEGAGGVFTDSYPTAMRLADSVKGGVEAVKRVIRDYGFSAKKLWTARAPVVDPFESEARYWWARNVANVTDNMRVGMHDIPLQERVYTDWVKQQGALQELEKLGTEGGITKLTLVDEAGYETVITNPDDLFRSLRRSKEETFLHLLEVKRAGAATLGSGEPARLELEHIARIANVRQSYLRGTQSQNELDDLFAEQYYQRQHIAGLQEKGLVPRNADEADLTLIPSWAKVSYDISDVPVGASHELLGAAYLEAKTKLQQQSVLNVFVKHAKDLAGRFVPVTQDDIMRSTRLGGGPGIVSSAQGNPGSIEAKMQTIGAATSDLKRMKREELEETINSVAHALAGKQDAAIEFAAVSNKVASTSEHYIANPDGSQSLVLRALADYRDAVARGTKGLKEPDIQPGAPVRIDVKSPEAWNAITTRIRTVGGRTEGFTELRAAQGLENAKDARTFYPVRQNQKDYQHFLYVVDPTVARGSAGHASMVHAASPAELERLREMVPGQYKVYTKSELEQFHKDYGDYNYELTLHENYIDADLKRAGINNAFFLPTNPEKIVKEWIEDEYRASDVFVREMVNAAYEKQFTELRNLGELYTNIGTSKYTGSYRFAENDVNNPYLSYVKTALDLNQASENRYIYGFNQLADSFFSRALAPISNAFSAVRDPADLDRINDMLQRVGAKSAYKDAAEVALANHTAPRGALATFVRRANAILANLTLGMDPLNAINNAVGASVLLGTETRHLVAAILKGNTEAAGELGQLMKVKIPGMDVQDLISSPSKLIARSYQRIFDRSAEGVARREFLQSMGVNLDLQKQFTDMLDDITLKGSENTSLLSKKIQSAMEKSKVLAEKGTLWTGNKLAESTNRLVAADVMLQLLEVGQRAGVVSAREFPAYINSFVNRTQGTFLASQRPLIFQGPIGQAVGLFQTYQFNLLQQLFRYVGEGSSKDVAMLLGLQGTIYGLNGLPAFNFINTHIVGTASGNPNHRDLYTATYGIAGKEAGDWLLYGLPSNLLQTNLYTRGDINPRHPTIIPTNPADIPIISATTKFFGAIKQASSRIGAGGDVWQSFLQGVEHQGLSRPLAGLAQVAQSIGNGGYAMSTSKQGTLVGANDLLSVATMSRLAGGRPIDESIALDAAYRTSVYKAYDQSKKDTLREAINTQVIGSGSLDRNEYESFSEGYAQLGGDTKGFNKYVLKRITETNTPNAERISAELKGPFAQNMQRIMGGVDITEDALQQEVQAQSNQVGAMK